MAPFILTIPASVRARFTAEAFATFCHENQPLRIERTPDGKLLVAPPPYSDLSRRGAQLLGQLGAWWLENRALGDVFDASAGFTLPDTSVRSPGVAWLSREKWAALTANQRERELAPVCPEFVIEWRSKSTALPALQRKMTNTWLANGTQLAFLLDVEAETAYVYRAGQTEPDVLVGFDRELSGETVLLGFQLDLRLLR